MTRTIENIVPHTLYLFTYLRIPNYLYISVNILVSLFMTSWDGGGFTGTGHPGDRTVTIFSKEPKVVLKGWMCTRRLVMSNPQEQKFEIYLP